MNKLLALADRVEKLTGPDREVDAEIAAETDYASYRGSKPVPQYTASLGPAMSLLPDNWDHMEVYRPDYQTLGWTVHVMYNANIDRTQITGFAQSHELALVAASLRARAHGEGEG